MKFFLYASRILAESSPGIGVARIAFVCFVVVHDKKTNIAVKGHVGEFTCAVVVDDTGDFVCKCAKAEHIGNGLVIDVVNDVVVLLGRRGGNRRRHGDRGVR